MALLVAWLVVSGVSLVVLLLIGSWTIHTFASDSIGATAIGIDSRGDVRIAYIDQGLRYATNAGGSWRYETLDGEHYVDRLSLALDSEDRTHIVYDACATVPPACRSRSSVEYLTDRGGMWTHRTLDANGEAPSLSLDSRGSAYVGYMSYIPDPASYFGFNLTLRYATDAGGSWTNGTAWGWGGSRDDPPYLPSIAPGPLGAVHIAFTMSLYLRYMTNESGFWDGIWFKSDVLSGEPPVLGMDSTGRLHLLFLGGIEWGATVIPAFSVIHGVRTDGNWSFERLDRASGVGPSSYSMALDAAGHVHVVYSDRGEGGLKYATNRGGSWAVTTLERGFVAGLYCSIAVDGLGRPHVAYVNFAGFEGSPPPLGARYATTTVNASNIVDFLTESVPLILFELLILLVLGAIVRWFRRRGRSTRTPSGPSG